MSRLGYSDAPTNRDYLGMEDKFDGLALFISECETPMTVAINGGWGTGKTSAMKIIQESLVKKFDYNEKDDITIRNQIIEFNTWEFSILNQGDLLLVNLLLCINNCLLNLMEQYGISEEDVEQTKNKVFGIVGAFFGVMAGGALGIANTVTGGALEGAVVTGNKLKEEGKKSLENNASKNNEQIVKELSNEPASVDDENEKTLNKLRQRFFDAIMLTQDDPSSTQWYKQTTEYSTNSKTAVYGNN